MDLHEAHVVAFQLNEIKEIAESQNVAYRTRWESMRDAPESKAEDVAIASLMLSHSEDDQYRIDAEARIWAYESELRDLIFKLHPGEDGDLILKQLDEFVAADTTKLNVAALAIKHASQYQNATSQVPPYPVIQRSATRLEITRMDAEVCAFWPFRPVYGGDGQIKRLEPSVRKDEHAHEIATPASVVNDNIPDPQRRLTLLRAMGGEAKYKNYEWRFSCIGNLVAAEQGRPRSDPKTIRSDLKEAAQAERDAKTAGHFDGMGC